MRISSFNSSSSGTIKLPDILVNIWLDNVACKLLEANISVELSNNFEVSITAPNDSKFENPIAVNALIRALISVFTTYSVSLPTEPVSKRIAASPSSSVIGISNTASPKSNRVFDMVACIIAEANKVVWSVSEEIKVKSKLELNVVGSPTPNRLNAFTRFSNSAL